MPGDDRRHGTRMPGRGRRRRGPRPAAELTTRRKRDLKLIVVLSRGSFPIGEHGDVDRLWPRAACLMRQGSLRHQGVHRRAAGACQLRGGGSVNVTPRHRSGPGAERPPRLPQVDNPLFQDEEFWNHPTHSALHCRSCQRPGNSPHQPGRRHDLPRQGCRTSGLGHPQRCCRAWPRRCSGPREDLSRADRDGPHDQLALLPVHSLPRRVAACFTTIAPSPPM
jgi:hypothetical protein